MRAYFPSCLSYITTPDTLYLHYLIASCLFRDVVCAGNPMSSAKEDIYNSICSRLTILFVCVAGWRRGWWWERREIVELRGPAYTFHRASERTNHQPLFAQQPTPFVIIIFMRASLRSWIGSAPPLWCKIRHGRCCRSLIETLHFPRHQFSLSARSR